MWSFGVHAQNKSDLDMVSATKLSNRKQFKTVIQGSDYTYFQDTSYTLIIVARFKTISNGDKVRLMIGPDKDMNSVFSKSIQIKTHGRENETLYAHSDDEQSVELGTVQQGFLQVFFFLPIDQLKNIKWLTASIKNESYESEKKYYEFK